MFTFINITGTYTNADSTPATGRITAVPSSSFSNDGVTIPGDPVSVDLVNGTVDFLLAATNDVNTTPTNVTYTFYTQIVGQPVQELTTTIPNDLVNDTISVTQLPAPSSGGGGGITSGASSVVITNVPTGPNESLFTSSANTAAWFSAPFLFIVNYNTATSSYTPRPVVAPAGSAFYKGPTQPVDNLPGDLWLSTS